MSSSLEFGFLLQDNAKHVTRSALPSRINRRVCDRTKEQVSDGPSPPHLFACERRLAVGLSTRINGAEGMALLYQVETSIAETLSGAPGRVERKTAGLLLLKLQRATWVK